jgi:hypothetical protein
MSLVGEKVRTQPGLCGIIERCELRVLKVLRSNFLAGLPQGNGSSKTYFRRDSLRITNVLATATQTEAVAGGRERYGHQRLGWQDPNSPGVPEPLLSGYVQLGFPDDLPPPQPPGQCSLREIIPAGSGGHGRGKLGSWSALGGKPEAHGGFSHSRFFTGF